MLIFWEFPVPPQKMYIVSFSKDFPGGSDGKVSAYNEGDPGTISRSEDPLEEGMETN